jgi:hypothetical protein
MWGKSGGERGAKFLLRGLFFSLKLADADDQRMII